jgi:hypothetical protein
MDHTIRLGGRDRTLRYTDEERMLLERAFPRPDGTPGSLFTLARTHLNLVGSLEVQASIIWAGIKHEDKKLTMAKVAKWLRTAAAQCEEVDELVEKIFNPVLAALSDSRIFGMKVDMTLVRKKDQEEVEGPEEGEEGKDKGATRPVQDY